MVWSAWNGFSLALVTQLCIIYICLLGPRYSQQWHRGMDINNNSNSKLATGISESAHSLTCSHCVQPVVESSSLCVRTAQSGRYTLPNLIIQKQSDNGTQCKFKVNWKCFLWKAEMNELYFWVGNRGICHAKLENRLDNLEVLFFFFTNGSSLICIHCLRSH